MTQANLFDREAHARDVALDRIEWSRAKLVKHGRAVAVTLCARNGRVTSTEVMTEMMRQAKDDAGLAEELDGADPRWLGAVFRGGTGWRRIGWDHSGSHKRPVAVWTR